jgi:pheromone shutdown protein TraB
LDSHVQCHPAKHPATSLLIGLVVNVFHGFIPLVANGLIAATANVSREFVPVKKVSRKYLRKPTTP